MKKKMIAISILLVLVSALSFAGGGNESAGGKTTLKVLNYTDLTVANAAAFEKWMWETFLQNNPDVSIDKEDLFNEPFHDKTNAYIASGNIPDVMYVWPSGRSTGLHQNKLLKDLTPFIRKDNLQGKYVAVALDPTQQASGYQAMLPQSITASHTFYVNTEVLDACGLKPAKTYAELKAQVPVLKAKGYETVIMPNKDTWVMQSCLFSAIAGRFCGAGWENKILSGQAKFTDPDFVAALSFIRQLYADNVISRNALGIDYGEGPGLFATNKSAYYIDGDWRVGSWLTDASTGEALISPEKQKKILVTVFPDIEGAKINKTTSVIPGVGYAMSAAIPAGSPREDAAWRLIKWLLGPEVLSRRLETGGIATPTRNDVDFSKIKMEPMQVAVGNLGKEYSVGTCVIDGVFHSDVYTPINDGLVELGLGQKTGAQVAATVQAAYNTWKAKN
ncbi:MAG: extracellular solute-binding protein [Treponema sp.]|jgi:raffinose/stachyose/melibiose transport system substrate-binding protein|nr:extracellular solute-binding protein [Treponema sp.]